MTLNLNKKHVLFQVERFEEVFKTAFLVKTKATCPPELKKTFLERTQRRLEIFCFAQGKKAVFIIIRYPKTSETQDLKNQSTKPSLRKLAQPKLDSAFEQKTCIVPTTENSASPQNIIFSWNQRKQQSWARTDIFETYSTSFWKVYVFLSVKSPSIFRMDSTKNIKTIAHNTKRRRRRFRRKSKAVFLSIRYRKTSQTQDVKSQSTKPSVRKLAQ